MPLYKCSAAQYAGFLKYFNNNSVNGKMGRNELRAALNRAGCNPTVAELNQVIDLVSVETNGISWQCFIDFVSAYKSFRDVEEEYSEAFRLFDRSGSGYLTREDIKYVLGKLGNKIDIDRLMDEVDTNRDNTVDYDEFCALMRKTVL